MKYEELITHMETHRNKMVDLLKDYDNHIKEQWIIWLKMELEAELGLRKRGEVK